MNRLIIHNINHLYTSVKIPPVKGKAMREILTLDNAFIIIEGEKIIEVGQGDYQKHFDKDTKLYDGSGLIAIPGLIDSHTHLVFGGSREHEFTKKIAGVDYLDILKAGGGILSTVEMTKTASFSELVSQARSSLDEMLLFGVTSLEAKSGYGLDLDTELKTLKVIKHLNETHPIDIKSTYLGAHALPPEYKNNRSKFIQKILGDLEIIKKENLAEYADVFCEKDVFTALETKTILEKAKSLGFKLRVHTDEIESIGGTQVALKLGSKTVDHLMAIKEDDILNIAKTDTIANLLPSTSFFLNKYYAPARKLIDSGAAVSVSSDYNPGSTPSENFQLTMQISGNKLKMLPSEILTAATINPAFSLDISNDRGSLEPGKFADVVLLKAKNLDYFIYHYGINHTHAVFKNGKLIVNNRMIIKED